MVVPAPPVALLNPVIAMVLSEIKKKVKELKSVKGRSESMQLDLKRFVAQMDDELTKYRDALPKDSAARQKIEVMRNLAHDMEDCLERFRRPGTRKQIAGFDGFIPQSIRVGNRIRTLNKFAKEMKKLNKSLQEEDDRQRRFGGDQATCVGPSARERHILKPNPVGIEWAKNELLTLLNGEPNKLRVICIMGFGGSGKANLANAVYRSTTVDGDQGFPLRAIVDRADYNDDKGGLLRKIIEQFWRIEVSAEADESYLRNYINQHLGNDKRYLVVLLDMDKKLWESIENIFKDVAGTRSRVIVTTSMLDMANHCRNYGNGYVYLMRAIGPEGSKKISSVEDIDPASQNLLKKCDGLPLALASVARHLCSEDGLAPNNCKTLCNDLGSFLHDTRRDRRGDFATLRGVLMDNYAGLSDGTVRSCLLYLGIFQNDGHLIKRSKVTRRWVAEGYAPRNNGSRRSEQDVADDTFNELIERNIIQPIGIRDSTKVLKTCKTLSIVHEFVLKRSIFDNFIMGIDGPTDETSSTQNKGEKKAVRHIFVNDSNATSSEATTNVDLSRVRSLTVVAVNHNDKNPGSGSIQAGDETFGSGSAAAGFFKFSEYNLIRVLDLEDSSVVRDSHLKDICKLWNLRYLSLGPKIWNLPNEIKNLTLLESLRLSEKEVPNELPVEVMEMPRLIHLIGKFKMAYKEDDEPSVIELTKKSNLQTLAGFVADGTKGFLLLMPHMKKLRKVKIWCKSNGGIQNLNIQLIQAIEKYNQPNHKNCSLSIDFEGVNQHDMETIQIVRFHNNSYPFSDVRLNTQYLSSLKLYGNLSMMPQFVTLLEGITKLCLTFTVVTQIHLSAISGMGNLNHLKLTANRIFDLIINVGEFKEIKSLCFVVQEADADMPQIQVERGALQKLISLQLLCKRVANLSGVDIIPLIGLREIELHPDISEQAREFWEVAARTHPNRPNVLPMRSVDDHENPVAGAEAEEVQVVNDVIQHQTADEGVGLPLLKRISTAFLKRIIRRSTSQRRTLQGQ